ncbi:MAG: HAD family hydrolase [Candidatus Hodarchaeota archaeon]
MVVKCIIFDLGGVIVELDFSRFFNEVITPSPLNKPSTPIMMEFFRQSDTFHQGKITKEEFYQLACELLQVCSLNQKDFYAAFNSIIADINLEILELIRNIKEFNNVKLMCLSNINISHWKYLKKQNWDIWNLFDDFILSHEIQLAKPDPAIFELAIRMAKCRPEEILFVDDGLNNVKAASALKINAIHFNNIEKLKEDLLVNGIEFK